MATLSNRPASPEGTVYQAPGKTALGELLDFVVAFPTHNVFRKNSIPIEDLSKANWTECRSFKLDKNTKPEDLSAVFNEVGKFLVKFNPSSAAVEQIMYVTDSGPVWILHGGATRNPMHPVREFDAGYYFWPLNQR